MVYKLLRLIHFWWCANFNFSRTKVGDNPHVGRGTNLFFPDFGFIGNNFYLGRYCSVEVNIKISDNVIIGNYCALVGRNDHKYDIPGVYMRHENSAREFSPKYDRKKEFIEIEKDVWIGHGTIILLLLSSYLIYFKLQGFFLVYLILISLVAYFSVKVYKFNFSRLSNFFGVIIPLLGLAWFKYYHYLISLEIVNFSYILPAGISFFTFQAISYVLDRKKERIYHDKDDSLLDVLFYISFFPQLIAGPIVKYNEFNFQISLKKFNFNLFYEGLSVFIYGLFLKIFLADNISEFTGTLNQIDMLNSYGDISKIILVFSYSFQIYFDFSGYSLMAIGLGKTFGYNLPINFNIH